MIIILNGKEEILNEGVTLAEFISLKGFNPYTIIIDHNYKLVKSENWAVIVLKDKDKINIINYIGGG